MKRFVLWAVVPAFAGLILAAGQRTFAAEFRTQPSICVMMQEKGDAFSLDPIYLRLMDGDVAEGNGAVGCSACGGVADAKGPNGCSWSYDYATSYQVISARPGHFTVLAHYDINWNGLSMKVDRILPVWEKKPDQAKWSNLNRHFTAFAYLTASATR